MKPEKHIFNDNFLIIRKTYVHYLRQRFINQKLNVKTGVYIFTKKQKYRRLEIDKKTFSVTSFQKFLIFPICTFSENGQCFIGAFL